MPRQCLFCPNPVDSAEHIWSDWILNDLKQAPSIRVAIGKKEPVWLADPNVTIECVCRNCNNGWMSRLEEANKLAIRAMINNESCGLTKSDQERLSRWAVLKAMVLESCNDDRQLFYNRTQRTELKTSSTVPSRTLVWLGRLSTKGFHAGGTDAWGDIDAIPRASHSCVTTVVAGHLVVQILTVRVIEQFATQAVNIGCKMGDWNATLLGIWPSLGLVVWPPELSFVLARDSPHCIATVINRWKLGTNVG